VAETGGNDKWQRAELTIAMAGNSKHHLEKEIQTVRTFIDNICFGYAEILSVFVDFI